MSHYTEFGHVILELLWDALSKDKRPASDSCGVHAFLNPQRGSLMMMKVARAISPLVRETWLRLLLKIGVSTISSMIQKQQWKKSVKTVGLHFDLTQLWCTIFQEIVVSPSMIFYTHAPTLGHQWSILLFWNSFIKHPCMRCRHVPFSHGTFENG